LLLIDDPEVELLEWVVQRMSDVHGSTEKLSQQSVYLNLELRIHSSQYGLKYLWSSHYMNMNDILYSVTIGVRSCILRYYMMDCLSKAINIECLFASMVCAFFCTHSIRIGKGWASAGVTQFYHEPVRYVGIHIPF